MKKNVLLVISLALLGVLLAGCVILPWNIKVFWEVPKKVFNSQGMIKQIAKTADIFETTLEYLDPEKAEEYEWTVAFEGGSPIKIEVELIKNEEEQLSGVKISFPIVEANKKKRITITATVLEPDDEEEENGEDENGEDENGEDENGEDENGEDENGEDENGEDENGENGNNGNGNDGNGDNNGNDDGEEE